MNDENIAAIRARLRFATVDEFVQGYARYVSSGGIFIPMPASKLKPVGTTLRFQLLLASGDTAILGEGVVHKVHGPQAASSKPIGLLVKFTRLTPPSKKLVDVIIASKNTPPSGADQPSPQHSTRHIHTSLPVKPSEPSQELSSNEVPIPSEPKATYKADSDATIEAAFDSALYGLNTSITEQNNDHTDHTDHVTQREPQPHMPESLKELHKTEATHLEDPPSPKPAVREDEDFFSLAQSYAESDTEQPRISSIDAWQREAVTSAQNTSIPSVPEHYVEEEDIVSSSSAYDEEERAVPEAPQLPPQDNPFAAAIHTSPSLTSLASLIEESSSAQFSKILQETSNDDLIEDDPQGLLSATTPHQVSSDDLEAPKHNTLAQEQASNPLSQALPPRPSNHPEHISMSGSTVTLARTQAGLEIMSSEGESNALHDGLESFNITESEADLDQVFDNIFGGSGGFGHMSDTSGEHKDFGFLDADPKAPSVHPRDEIPAITLDHESHTLPPQTTQNHPFRQNKPHTFESTNSEIGSLLGSFEHEPDDDDLRLPTLTLSHQPTNVAPTTQDETPSLEMLIANTQREIEEQAKTLRESTNKNNLIDSLLAEDLPTPSEVTFVPLGENKDKKKPGFFSKLLGRDE